MLTLLSVGILCTVAQPLKATIERAQSDACISSAEREQARPQVKTRVIDEGGTGIFKAIAVKEKGMEDFVVYRPKDLLHAHARCGALPLLLFGNGGCSDTNVGYERMLSEVASHGYIVVAIGEMRDSLNERPIGQTESAELMGRFASRRQDLQASPPAHHPRCRSRF